MAAWGGGADCQINSHWLWNKQFCKTFPSVQSFYTDLSKSSFSICIPPETWLFALFFCCLTSVLHHHYRVWLLNKSPQRKPSGMYSAHAPQCGFHPRPKIYIVNRAQLNNIHPLNFYGAFLGTLFIFLFIFKGNKRSNRMNFLFFVFFSFHIMSFTSWFQLCMRFLSMNVWCLTVQKALQVFCMEHGKQSECMLPLKEQRMSCGGMATFLVHGFGSAPVSTDVFTLCTSNVYWWWGDYSNIKARLEQNCLCSQSQLGVCVHGHWLRYTCWVSCKGGHTLGRSQANVSV